MPVLLLSAGQAGATSPAALAGAVVQAVAECLAGLVYVNAIVPGAPAIFGPWPFVSDLRTGAMSGGSGEQGLLSAACAQMAQFYDLVGGVAAGMTDSKLPDMQAGCEKGLTTRSSPTPAPTWSTRRPGCMASLLGFAHESLVIDNDIIGAVLRTMRGIEVDDEALSVEVIREVCLEGPATILAARQTLELMQNDYVYPLVGDRTSPKEWIELGSTDVVERAARKAGEILGQPLPGPYRPGERRLRPRAAADSPAARRDAAGGAAAQGSGGMSGHCRAVVIGGGAVGAAPSITLALRAGPTACCSSGTS